MPALRLLLLNYEFPPLGGGAGTATAAMAREYAAAGHEVVVLTSAFRGLPAEEEAGGARVLRVPVLRRRADRCTPPEMLTYTLSAALAALRLARRWRPDLVVAFFGIPSGPVGWLLKKRRRVPLVISLRGGDVPGFDCGPRMSAYHRLAGPIIRFLWRRADLVVANGQGLSDLAHATAPDVDVVVVPNGVDVRRYSPAPEEGRAAPGAPRLLFVGRLAQQKAADVLLAAAAALREPFELDIVGDGPDRPALEAAARRTGIEERVHFHGWQERDGMPERYRAADVFVLPSRVEGIPNVVLEAMASGLPVVATAVPGTTELVRDGVTGILVPAEDVPALARALDRLLADASLRRRLGNAGRARVEETFTWAGASGGYLRAVAARVPALAGRLGLDAPVGGTARAAVAAVSALGEAR